jgi:glucan biosynthesis protein
MEYFAGSIVTLVTMYIVAKLINHPKNDIKSVKTNFSQTRQHELVADFIPMPQNKPTMSQSIKHERSHYTRIFFIADDAYWIEDSRVYTAKFIDGIIDQENKETVDMTSIDKVELDKMIFVVERLTEGLSNDSGNSGN